VNAFELVAIFYGVVLCAKKLPGLFLCNLQLFDMLKKQHFEKKNHALDYVIRHPALCA
jgi:hypothetical protein